jgi:hypothetical protein
MIGDSMKAWTRPKFFLCQEVRAGA